MRSLEEEVECDFADGVNVTVGPGTVTVTLDVTVVWSVAVFSVGVGSGAGVTVTVGPEMVIVTFAVVVEWTVIVSGLGGVDEVEAGLDVNVEDVWVEEWVEVEVELGFFDVVLVVLCVASVKYVVLIGAPPPDGTTTTSVTYTFLWELNDFEVPATEVDVDGACVASPVLVLEPEKGLTFPTVMRFVDLAEEMLDAGSFGADEEAVV